MPQARQKNLEAEFIISAVSTDLFPEGRCPEIAFLGRSNVGKSTLLNCLLGEKGLARTSATPGCTQGINFFRVGDKLVFVDLPGYGYAKVPLSEKARWKRLVEGYLFDPEPSGIVHLLLDARRGWMEPDLELKEWLESQAKPYVVVATKIDKLKVTRKESAAWPHIPGGIPGWHAGAVLGRNRPGSKRTLASDLENAGQPP